MLGGKVSLRNFPDAYQGWVVEIDSNGNVLWQKGYEAGSSDGINTITLSEEGILALGFAFPRIRLDQADLRGQSDLGVGLQFRLPPGLVLRRAPQGE